MLFDTTIILSLLYIFQFCNKKDLQLFETQVGCGVKITWVGTQVLRSKGFLVLSF